MSLQLFKEKLEEYKGEYTFNFAKDDDCAYLFEEYGGEENMKTRFPALYQSYLNAREASLEHLDDPNETFTGGVGKIRVNYLSQEENNEDSVVQLEAPVSCVFTDATTKVECEEPAAEWLGVTVLTKIKDIYSPRYLIRISKVIEATNKFEGKVHSNPEKLSDINNKSYCVSVELTGVDPENKLCKKIVKNQVDLGNVEYPAIADIKIDDPAPKNDKHKISNEIMMLYGRLSEQPIYKDADYKGDDFLNNTFSNGKVHLLMPISGKIIYDYNVEPLELLAPTEDEALSRSQATYEYKQQVFTYRSDITDDKVLYDKLKGCFQNGKYVKSLQTPVTFDIKIPDGGRSVYDWHTDVEGIQNGDPKTVYLVGVFTYCCIDQLGFKTEDQITIKSLSKEDLAKYGADYYKYEKGTNVIYIPPITIYWGCFGKDVRIMLADKSEKYAGNIKIGDQLLGFDGQVLTVDNVLTGFDTEIYLIKTQNGGEIKVSGGHPMMCEGKCIRASRIKAGDQLNLADGSLSEVVSVEMIEYNDMVYNFTFEGVENGVYIIANGFYTGDLRMQNTKTERTERVFTEEEKALIAEMMQHNQELMLSLEEK